MTIVFTGRKAHLTPDLKSFIEAKLGKLDRVLDDILDTHVILKREKHRHMAEIVVRSRFATLTAKAVGGEFHESAGLCVERLQAQAKKHSGRLQTRRRGRGAWKAPRRSAEAALAATPGPLDGDEAVSLVRMGRVPVRPMSVREAVHMASEDGRPVVIFRDPESKEIAVVFRRPDGRFGLLEMEA